MSDKSKAKPEVWIYCHRYCNQHGELWFMYVKADELEDIRTKAVYYGKPLCSKKKNSPPLIGGLYEVMVDRSTDACTVTGTAKYVGPADVTKEKRLEWSTRDEGEHRTHQELKALKKAKKESDSLMWEALDPIKLAYWKSNVIGKRAILAKLIEYVSGRPPKSMLE